MNEREQHDFENYLREFRPHTPKGLPVAAPTQTWRRLAAAIVIVVGGSVFMSGVWHRSPAPPMVTNKTDESLPPRQSTISLTRLALEDPETFESRMDQHSLETLKHFDQPDSALRAIAKD